MAGNASIFKILCVAQNNPCPAPPLHVSMKGNRQEKMNQQLCMTAPVYAEISATPARALNKGTVNAMCWLT
jgi:hypothetical protein